MKGTMDYNPTALDMALSVILDAATKAMKISGAEKAKFPCEFEGKKFVVVVESDESPLIGNKPNAGEQPPTFI